MRKKMKLNWCLLVMIMIIQSNRSDAKSIVNSVTNEPIELELKENYSEYIFEFPKKAEKLKLEKNWKQLAEELYNLSDCFFQLNQYDDLKYIIKIASPFAKKHNKESYYKLKIIEQKVINDFGEYKKCIAKLKSLIPKVKSTKLENSIYLLLANSYYQLDEVDISMNYYEKILSNNANFLQKAQAYNGIGSCYFMNTQLDSAKYYYEKGLETCYRYNCRMHTRVGQILYNLGLLNEDQGNYKKSKELFENSLIVYKAKYNESNLKISEVYSSIGTVHLNTENIESSYNYYIKSYNLIIHYYGKLHPDLIFCYMNLGKLSLQKNDYSKAESYIINGLVLSSKQYSKSHNINIQLYTTLASIYLKTNNLEKAKKILSEVIAIESKSKYPSEYLGDAYCILGDCLLKQFNANKAITYYQKAVALYDNIYGNKNVYSIDALIGLSNSYIQIGDFKKALSFAQIATSYTIRNNQIIFPYDHWETQLQALICKKELYKTKQTNENAESIIAQIKQTSLEATKIKNTFVSINNQLHYAEKISELNKLGIYFLTHTVQKDKDKLADDLLFFIENDRANILRNNILNIKSNALLPEKYKDEEINLKSRLNYFTTMRENGEEESTPYFSLNDSILLYSNKYETFIKSLEKSYPKLYKYKYEQQKVSILQIQKHLNKKDQFIEYFNDNENYYCLVISKTGSKIFCCGNKNNIDSIVDILSASIQQKKYNIHAAALLGTKLINKEINYKNWIIAPDDLLNNVPFDALLYSNKITKPNYFLYHHTMQYTFSASIFCNKERITKNEQIQVFAPNFTNSTFSKLQTKNELSSLKKFKNYVDYNDTLSTKNNFIKNIPKAKVIHVASHLIVDTINPLKSNLIFQPSKDQSYFLSIDDIKKISINAQLITLAACKSNFGKTNFGEGLLNFPWSFYFAGARNILTTKWNASDKTTDNIIAEFYTNLRKGKSKSEAIQKAKIKYLATTDAIGAQPFFWANFALNGDASSINIAPSFLEKFWWLPILFLLFMFFINFQLKRK